MISETMWLELCQQLKLSKQAQKIVETIRSSPPARRVQSRAGNVRVRYPSRKMGVTIQAESHHNELAGIYEKEHDPEVLEYYDQPPPIKLVYQAKSGRRVGVWHTADFFVIDSREIGWEEWKMEAELVRLAEKMPNRYVRDEEGDWRCPPGEEYAAQYGFFYRLRSSAEIDWIFQRNMLFLEDYLRDDCPLVGKQAREDILSLVAANPGMTLDELLRTAEISISDDLYGMIASEEVYIDVRLAPLAEPGRVRVFPDKDTSQAYMMIAAEISAAPTSGIVPVRVALGAAVSWDERRWTIINLGRTATTLLAEDGSLVELPNASFDALVKEKKLVGEETQAQRVPNAEVQDLLAKASPTDFQEANRRYAILFPHLAGQPAPGQSTPARTVRHWLSCWREAEQLYHCGYVGLLPRRWAQGNRRRKLPEQTLTLLEEFIRDHYETLKQQSKYAVYGMLIRQCEAEGITAPSYKTFAWAVTQRPREKQVRKRQGPRAAYQHTPFYRELTLTTPRHGDRPFEIGHIDHTELDIELVCSRTGRNLGRPWVTFLTDAFSRRLLAVSLTFDPPSYRSCLMILRECVRRHQRFPQILVVDGGRDFESIYFETLLARYECTKKTRPSAQPRFGSVCERLFGTTNTRFINNLQGNTQMMSHVRQVTKSVAPRTQAIWTLSRFYVRLCEWAYDVYETLEHPALGQSPREAFEAGLNQGGHRAHRMVPYDESFRMLTLPTTRKGTAKVIPGLGVKIRYIHYWSDAMRDPTVEKTQVPVRYDPFDSGSAYAFIQGRWTHCVSEHYASLAGRSEREMMLATAELRKRHQHHQQHFSLTARKLADFLASLEAEEVLLEQRLRDLEIRDMLAQVADDRVSHTQIGQLNTPFPTLAGNQVKSSEDQDDPDQRHTLVMYEDY